MRREGRRVGCKGDVTAAIQGNPLVGTDAAAVAGLADASTALNSTHVAADGHQVGSALDINLVATFAVGIEAFLATAAEDITTAQVHVAIRVNSIVAGCYGIDVTALEVHVRSAVQGVIIAGYLDVAAVDGHDLLGLNTLRAFTARGAHCNGAAVDGNVAVHLDTLGRGASVAVR